MKNLVNAMTFVEVAKAKSFVSAANQIGLSTSATSKAVAKLEQDLGVKLLQRTTRSVSLTPEGEQFLSGFLNLQSELNGLLEEVKGDQRQPSGCLRVSVPPVYGRAVLMKMVGDFLKRYPKMQLDISFDSSAINLASDAYDLAIRAGELPDSANLVARRIDTSQRLTVASPNYLATRPSIQSIADLSKHLCIANHLHTGSKVKWVFEQNEKKIKMDAQSQLYLDDLDAIYSAVLNGLGVGQLFDFMLKDDLKSGAVKEVLADYRPKPLPIYAIYLDRRLVSPRIRVFIDFLVEKLSED